MVSHVLEWRKGNHLILFVCRFSCKCLHKFRTKSCAIMISYKKEKYTKKSLPWKKDKKWHCQVFRSLACPRGKNNPVTIRDRSPSYKQAKLKYCPTKKKRGCHYRGRIHIQCIQPQNSQQNELLITPHWEPPNRIKNFLPLRSRPHHICLWGSNHQCISSTFGSSSDWLFRFASSFQFSVELLFDKNICK